MNHQIAAIKALPNNLMIYGVNMLENEFSTMKNIIL